jgi:protoporphyrinogen oxidase
MDSRVIILGAGVTGLSLSWRLGILGVKTIVLESSGIIGGLAGTLREDGYCMDFGPHSFFSEDTEILDTVLKLFDNTLTPKPRRVKFYYQGRFLDYPLTPHGVLFQMGFWPGVRAALSFIKSKIKPRARVPIEDETVEDWAIGSFGEHLYRTFFKPYTEQFWKVSCTELSSRSIPTHTRMSFINTCRLLLQQRQAKINPSIIEREMLPTYYPDSGFGEIPEQIANAVKDTGGQIYSECRAIGVSKLPDARVRVKYEYKGEQREIEGSHVVSTIPLNQFVKMINPSAPPKVLESAERLDYRSLMVLGMVTEKKDILNCSYIYVLNRPYNRIAEMNEFNPTTSHVGENIIMVEIPCLMDSAAWTAPKEQIFDMCIGSLAEDGFLQPGDVKRLIIIRAPNAYPIYRKGYAAHLKRLLDYIDAQDGLSTLGRTGEFMYMDIDECMRKAFNFADFLQNKHS